MSAVQEEKEGCVAMVAATVMFSTDTNSILMS